MKNYIFWQIQVCFFLIAIAPLQAQKSDSYVKSGSSLFFLSDGQEFNHAFVSLGLSFEHQFSGQFSTNLNMSAARLLSSKFDYDYIRNVNSLEAELRFYPNNKGRGFYAGVSAVWYKDTEAKGFKSEKSNHFGSHINVGAQFPLSNRFYLQANSQTGIYGKGFYTIARYGIQIMACIRL